MDTTRLKRRLAKLERIQPAKKDATFTLEEFCRLLWRESRRNFLKIARDNSLGYLVGQFEREDAERNKLAGHHLLRASRR